MDDCSPSVEGRQQTSGRGAEQHLALALVETVQDRSAYHSGVRRQRPMVILPALAVRVTWLAAP